MTVYTLLPVLFLSTLAFPLIAAVVALFSNNSKVANTIVQALFAITGAVGLVAEVAYFVSLRAGQTISPWLTIPGINLHLFRIDTIPVFFLALISLGTLIVSLYAMGYLPRYAKTYSFPMVNAASALFLFGMLATVLSATVFTFLLFWEIMSMAAYFLVIADREPESLNAGFIYIVMTHFGFLCLAVGFLLLAKGDPFASFGTLQANAATMSFGMQTWSFMLLFAGFGSKAGLVPLHQWLPYAHPQAPSHSSALMSGVMLKVALFGFLQAMSLFPGIAPAWSLTVLIVGLLSATYGVLFAAIETDIKRLLAWSSIENMGLIFSALGALGVLAHQFPSGELYSWFAGLLIFIFLHSLNHLLFKVGLFMAAGTIISETHTRDLDQLGGLAQKWPAFSAAFLGLVFAAAALPPFGTFFGEWVYLQGLGSAFRGGSTLVGFIAVALISILALVAGFAVFTFAKTFASAFLGRARSESAEHAKPLPVLLSWPVGFCALASLAIGVAATPVLTMIADLFLGGEGNITWGAFTLTRQGSINGAWIAGLVVALGVIVVGARWLLGRRHATRITETWDCGQPITPHMEYTATGFSAPLRFFFRAFLLSNKHMVVEPVTPGNPWIAQRRLEWSLTSFWEHYLYRPLTKLILKSSGQVKRLQSGIIQLYIALILVTLVIVLFVAL